MCDTNASYYGSGVDGPSSDEVGFVDISLDTINKMNVSDLRYFFKVHGLLLMG